MIQIDQIRTPPGGWHFFDAGIRLEAPTYQELYQKVLKFRLGNRHPIDRLQEEINNYVASISPTHVIRRIVNRNYRKEKSLPDRIYNWSCVTYDNLKSERERIPSVEAEKRALICLSCPMNKAYKSSCGDCASQTQRLCGGIRRGARTSLDERLGGCQVHGFDIPTAVHLGDDTLGEKTPDDRMPHNCWRRP